MKVALSAIFVLLAPPALAHPGAHGGMDVAALAAHLFETDHIVFALIAGAVGVLAYRAGRRAEAKAQEARRHDPR